jgi:hypothetical protein
MPPEIAFIAAAPGSVDAERETAARPMLVCSVEQAFDVIDSLPENKRRLARWREARIALRRLYDNPQDVDLAKLAADHFRAALLAEGWLD